MRQISYYYHTTPFEDILKELQKRKRRKIHRIRFGIELIFGKISERQELFWE